MTNELPEAPFVAFTAIEKDGYTWNVTVRKGMTQADIKGMFDLIAEVQKKAQVEGYIYKAPVRGGFPPKKELKYVEGEKCPTCASPLVEAHKKTGELYWKCSTNKYDFATKKSTGCAYVNWNPVKEQAESYADHYNDLKND